MIRRQFLQCLGGAMLALPTLEACSKSQGSPTHAGKSELGLTGPAAKRLVAMGVWNGVVPKLWYPQGGTETSFTLPPMLAGLAPHQANLLLLKGLDNVAAEKTAGTNGHAEGVASLLSGMSPYQDPLGSNQWHSEGQTVDQAIAKAITASGALTRYESLQVGCGHTGGGYGCISYAGKGQGMDPQTSPESLFGQMFQDAQSGADAIRKARARRKSVLDGAISDYQTLSGKISGEDKRRVDAHLQALRDLELRLNAAATCSPTNGRPPSDAGDDERWRAFLDLTVLAFSCDLTRVVTFSFDHGGGGGVQFPWIGVTDDWHELSHQAAGERATGGPGTDKFVKVHQWFTDQLAYFVGQLKTFTTADGTTLFDETVIVQGSELGFDHTHYDVPFLLLAGDKTPIRAGRYVNLAPSRPIYIEGASGATVYPEGTAHNKLLTSLLHAFGGTAASFGDLTLGNVAGDLDAVVLKT